MDKEEYKEYIRSIKPELEIISEPNEYDVYRKIGLADALYIMTGIDLRRKKSKNIVKDKNDL